MENIDFSTPPSRASNLKNQCPSSTSSPLPPSMIRLWRTAAQRNLRNQWSKLASYHKRWASFSSSVRYHATSLVNAYLSQRYMPSMELGALNDMPGIREKACWKLFKQQEIHRSKLLSSYKDMVDVVSQMVNTTRSMRCYLKGTSINTLVQFSYSSGDNDDTGDGGRIPVFTFLPISSFEKVAEELVQMFTLELSLKRLLVVEFLSISSEGSPVNRLKWSDELYPGEFDDLCLCNLYSKETNEPLHPRSNGLKSDVAAACDNYQPSHEVLQVYLVTWLAEVKIDSHRVDEIFGVVGEEMHVNLL